MNMTPARRFALLRLLLVSAPIFGGALAGCGQKGPLYLPDDATSVITRPATTTPAPAAPATDAPAPDDPDKKKNSAPSAPKP